mmetsp:Transcript_12166/g.18467  ORF Transcript_12166/g.18467 Transcript_12166/m.18467 type:complete len:236 (+) Transcript_12166:77-784(+)|eukprot:CAMPEP_0203647490 /NCGR_PEP_ID=MMETSP0088-20131115/15847_1 /ASSEMBLY_ACC=CAM_ASM_001087 /TAXON_ID=426623 /ORGANISM="Chaetoceros affinis, Strain CCMP159" /LENGTH=235 /DNA_ID=CAMNT_0050505133 /DNA_START=16 /DNA_END=723 /DNA_ORIENTATION=+
MNLIVTVTVVVSIISSTEGLVSEGRRPLANFLEQSLDEPIPEEVVCMETLGRKSFSKAIPFMRRPPLLKGEYPGDVGFDPLELAKTKEDLMKYREAEVKHCRLAMLAALGWPVSELFDGKIAEQLNLPPVLDSAGRAPSILNGFDGINLYYWFAVLLFAAYVDTYGIYRSTQEDNSTSFPGDLGFDPLGLYPEDEKQRKVVQLAEIKHGRLAMIAVVIYTLEELLSDSGIILPTL